MRVAGSTRAVAGLARPVPSPSRGGHAAAFDEERRERRADQAAAHDASHGGGHGDGRGALDTRLLEERRESQAGRGTARQRHRTGQHTEQRRLAEGRGGRRADHVLRTATAVAKRKKRSTSGPPSRSSWKLAPKPMAVKNAFWSGV